MNGPDFPGEENQVDLLTGLSDLPSGVGRPSELTDESLMRAARDFQHVLEHNWGAVGGRLRVAKAIPDVREAFKHVQHMQCSRLELFTRSETRRSNGNTLRTLRKQLQQTREEIYKATVAQRYARDWHERAKEDWAHEQDEQRKQKLEFACSDWRWKSQDAVRTSNLLKADWDRLTEELRESEAHFAQSEVLEFIRNNDRREFMPFNVAAAMAGMPYLSARVSCDRVWAQKPQFTKGQPYLVFQVFNLTFSESPDHADGAVQKIREYLLAQNRARLGHVKELRKNWFYVELAIRSTFQEPKGPRGSLPFRIFGAYTGRFTRQQRGDRVLAETKRLLLEGERPELESLPGWV